MFGRIAAALVAEVMGLSVLIAASGGGEATTWLSGGGAAAAVGGLAYIAKKLAAGELVALPVKTLQEDAARREDRLVRLVEDAQERDEAHRALLLSRELRDRTYPQLRDPRDQLR